MKYLIRRMSYGFFSSWVEKTACFFGIFTFFL